jgi:hypothetical protein
MRTLFQPPSSRTCEHPPDEPRQGAPCTSRLAHYLWVIGRTGRFSPQPPVWQKPIVESLSPRRVLASGVIFCREVPVFSAPE